MKHFPAILAALGLALSSACTIALTPTQAPPPQMQTAAALTVDAVLSNTPQATPPPPQQTLAPTLTLAAASSTPSAGPAQLTVEDVTNCRSGPGTNYERIAQIPGGMKVNIVGSYPGYWLVQSDSGICWITMEFSTPTGDLARVPTVTQPSTPSAGAPKPPSLARYDYICNGQDQIELSLRWTDKSSNESGFRIYINGKVFVELPADSSQYSLTFDRAGAPGGTFNIEAFNSVGTASTSVVTISC